METGQSIKKELGIHTYIMVKKRDKHANEVIKPSSLQLMSSKPLSNVNSSSSKNNDDLAEISTKDLEELLRTVREMTDKLSDLRSGSLQKVCSHVQELSGESGGDDIVDYLECKQQMLLAYCQNLVYYLSLKAKGESVKSHPVMNQMLELRYAMEKMRPIDGKLHYQIDRLMKLSTLGEKEAELSSLRPDPSALLAKFGGNGDDNDEDEINGDDEDEEGEEDSDGDDESGHRNNSRDNSSARRQDQEKYRAPRMAAVPFKQAESELARRGQKLEKARRKMKNSEIVDALREEFSAAPEKSSSSGISGMSGEAKKLAAEAAERREYEEDRFVRTTMSRRDKQDIRRREADAQRIDNMNEPGDFDDLAEFSKLAGAAEFGSGKKNKRSSMDFGDAKNRVPILTSGSTALALQKAVKAFRSTSDNSSSLSGAKSKAGRSDEGGDGRNGSEKKIKKQKYL